MNILMVLSTKTFPPDGRVEREIRSLIGEGHKLFLMARRGPNQQKNEIVNGAHVIRVPLPFQKRKSISDFIYFFVQRYFILVHILIACKKHKIDALHVHDLPYALATTLAGKLLDIPVIFDMHEHYVVMLEMSFKAKIYQKFKPFAFILLSLLRLEEKIACCWAYKVIVVAEEHIPRIESLGTPVKNIAVVTNTEDINYFSGLAIDSSISHKYKNYFVILYVGAFSPHRGLETAIQAMPDILISIPNAILLLVGDGNNRQELEQMTKKMQLEDKIIFTGHQPFHTLPTYINLCDVGLIPHISTPHIETTMPNKIFQFMMFGKPVIVSNTKPMMRIINDANCGLVFKERNPKSLAETIIKLKVGQMGQIMGGNGYSAVKDRYHWQKTVKTLLEIYRNLQTVINDDT